MQKHSRILVYQTGEKGALTLESYLLLLYPTYSKKEIRERIRKGNILVNMDLAHPGRMLKNNDMIGIEGMDPGEGGYRPRRVPVEIVFENSDFLAVDKPAGIPVLPGRDKKSPSLFEGLIHAFSAREGDAGRVRVVHRLDRDTTGILLFAKNEETEIHLCRLFEARKIQKEYMGLVLGEVQEEEGEIDVPLLLNQGKRVVPDKSGKSRHGKKALTRFSVRERFRGFTLLDLFPHTGRTHQLRVHLSSMGFPLAVDPLYGGKDALYLSEIKPGYKVRRGHVERPVLARVPLHASKITFVLRGSAQPLTLEAALHKDMEILLKHLRRYREKK